MSFSSLKFQWFLTPTHLPQDFLSVLEVHIQLVSTFRCLCMSLLYWKSLCMASCFLQLGLSSNIISKSPLMTTSAQVPPCSLSEHLVLSHSEHFMCHKYLYVLLICLSAVIFLQYKLREVTYGLCPKLIMPGHGGCDQPISVDGMLS